jgi:hypothetical protein
MSITSQKNPNFVDNTNFLRVNKYAITFINLKEIMYFCPRVNIPTVGLNVIKRPTMLESYPIPGTKIEYDQTFSIDFFIDEDLRNYDSVYRWLISLAPVDDLKDYAKEFETGIWSLAPKNMRKGITDATISILTNSYTSNYSFIFRDVFPYSLTGFNMETSVSTPAPVTATAHFAFSRFHLEKG